MSKCQHFFISFRRRVSKKIFCMGLFKIEDIYFNRPNNLEDLRHRICVEMEQISISPDIIERNVGTVASKKILIVNVISKFA
jgi:hypothetical protein